MEDGSRRGLTADQAKPAARACPRELMDEWDEGAYLSDPAGVGPNLSFLKVPESKVVKNRVHLDVQAGGGRETPWEVRWPRVVEAVARLTGAGATVLREEHLEGRPDHVVMADPEGNEFCVL
ncbi:hypothetical protein F4556_007201 [Kitasatospora gansuensis]|uniref:Glyoxalase-like domain-containing protein n=1 Tax=Kitasatospora gansuensis TaxID=258050 RepID=A0A7W7SJL1_9ACTN|nr:VOC family protein [Kitasatospora gansuensis]MBB4951666.1 hypothetical protein [Kitasatospora gansuensis]